MSDKRITTLTLAVMSCVLFSCATTRDREPLLGVPDGAQAVIFLLKGGGVEFRGVDPKTGELFEARKCTIGTAPTVDQRARRAQESNEGRSGDECVALAPRKAIVTDLRWLSTVEAIPNPTPCELCIYIPDGHGGKLEVCLPPNCQKE